MTTLDAILNNKTKIFFTYKIYKYLNTFVTHYRIIKKNKKTKKQQQKKKNKTTKNKRLVFVLINIINILVFLFNSNIML